MSLDQRGVPYRAASTLQTVVASSAAGTHAVAEDADAVPAATRRYVSLPIGCLWFQ